MDNSEIHEVDPQNLQLHIAELAKTKIKQITMPKKDITFVTGNKNKLAEVRAILGNHVDLSSQSLDLPEIQGTIEEIALDKCRRAADLVGLIATCVNSGG